MPDPPKIGHFSLMVLFIPGNFRSVIHPCINLSISQGFGIILSAPFLVVVIDAAAFAKLSISSRPVSVRSFRP